MTKDIFSNKIGLIIEKQTEKRNSTHRKCYRERVIRCETLAGNVSNLPWSLCVKVQRRAGVNGVKENCRSSMINKGGTAEIFGPLWGWKALAVFCSLKMRKGEKNYEIKKSCRRSF